MGSAVSENTIQARMMAAFDPVRYSAWYVTGTTSEPKNTITAKNAIVIILTNNEPLYSDSFDRSIDRSSQSVD